MSNSILDNIKSLPALPKSIEKIDKIYNDENSSISELVKVIEEDPMIIANLLKAVNSPLYDFNKKIQTVAQAVSLLGMSITRSIIFGNSIRKLLNVDMEPYGISSETFADISSKQAALVYNWYIKLDKTIADKLFLAALLQEAGKILISNYIIKNDETTTFKSEIQTTHNIAAVEKAYTQETTASVTSAIFEHWGFDEEFVEMIRYSDNPSSAPQKIVKYCNALNIIKTIVAVNEPFSEIAINFGLKKAHNAGYNHELLEDSIDEILEIQNA